MDIQLISDALSTVRCANLVLQTVPITNKELNKKAVAVVDELYDVSDHLSALIAEMRLRE